MGTFQCDKCKALVDLLYVTRHECGAPGPSGGYACRPDGRNELDNPELMDQHLQEVMSQQPTVHEATVAELQKERCPPAT